MASHVSVQADSTVLPLLRGLRSPASDPVSHRYSEESLTAAALRTHKDEVTYEYDKDYHSYWGISHDLTSGNPLIVMPLRLTKGDPGVRAASCHHDVVAIHIDTLVPDRDDWNQSLNYLSGCIGRCMKRLDSDFEGNLPENNFKLLIFRDFSDLNSTLRELSVQSGVLEDPIRRAARISSLVSGIPSDITTAGINLRSLHILLPPGPAPLGDLQAELPLSSFFLSVMKGDDQHVDVGEYSTRIDCYYSYEDHQPELQLANFINLVRSFLLSINISTEKKEPFRDIARIGTIGRFLQQSNVLTNAFSTTNSGGVLDDPLSPPPRCLRSFDEIYKPATNAVHSAFYKWLNQFNLRLFSRPMFQGEPKDIDWMPRILLETEKHRIFDLFDKLDGLSDKWKEQTNLLLLKDPREDLWWEAELESGTDWEGEPLTAPQRSRREEKAKYYSYLKEDKGPRGNPLSQADRNTYRRLILNKPRPSLVACRKHLVKLREENILGDILVELIDEGHESQATQLEFYGHIIELFQKIWNNLSAPYTHHMLTKKYPHLRTTHNVKYLDLLLMSFYHDVERLCVRIEKFPSISETHPHAWDDYSQWEIRRRG